MVDPEHQRSKSSLNTYIRYIAADAATATHQEEILTSVVEYLDHWADFIWAGTLDISDWSLTPIADSEESFVDILTEKDDEVQSSIQTTITDEVVTTITPTDEWHTHAIESGYEAVALIPLVHGHSTYGLIVLGDTQSRLARHETALADLGVIVSHALAAVTRRLAMMGGEEIILEFREQDAAIPIIGEAMPPESEFHFERTIPLDDGSLLQYVTVSGMDPERFKTHVESFEQVTHIRRVKGNEEVLFETIYVGPSIVQTLVEHDAWVLHSYFKDGDHYTVAALPPTTDVPTVIDSVTETFPEIEVLSQRSIHDWRSTREFRLSVRERLTDRQRAAVKIALAAGYFERPRESTGEEIAEAMDINPSTYSQHLRAAHRKVYESLFTSEFDTMDSDP